MERLRPARAALLIALLVLGGVGRDRWHLALHADDAAHTGKGPVIKEACSICSEGLPTALTACSPSTGVVAPITWEGWPPCVRSADAVEVRIPADRGPPHLG